jgi:hypothetical protein
MGRPRCDPIDVAGVLDALASGRTTPLQAYREYASTAARPYARSSWQGIIDRARRGSIEKHVDQSLYSQIQNTECDTAWGAVSREARLEVALRAAATSASRLTCISV